MIRSAEEKDLDDILNIHRLAFGEEDEAELVQNLLIDSTAQPCLSLLAEQDGEAIGHVLITKATVKNTVLNAALLAPLAVKPDFHYKGTGKRLIKEAVKQLTKRGVDILFVLGDPQYYTKSGFEMDAAKAGFSTPHPIPKEWASAWMYMRLHDFRENGQVIVADQISAPEYWSD